MELCKFEYVHRKEYCEMFIHLVDNDFVWFIIFYYHIIFDLWVLVSDSYGTGLIGTAEFFPEESCASLGVGHRSWTTGAGSPPSRVLIGTVASYHALPRQLPSYFINLKSQRTPTQLKVLKLFHTDYAFKYSKRNKTRFITINNKEDSFFEYIIWCLDVRTIFHTFRQRITNESVRDILIFCSQ